MKERNSAIFFAVLAAALAALNAPLSKLLLESISPLAMASLLYLGAGAGMAVVGLLRRGGTRRTEAHLSKKELPYIFGMVLLDSLAPILMLIGLQRTTAANASLLGNFELVATALIALFIFREQISKRLWAGISLIVVSGAMLFIDDFSSMQFSFGSLLVAAASTCWGLENNCTRVLSVKDPLEVVVVKGFGSGACSLVVALAAGAGFGGLGPVLLALLLGFVSSGLSIYMYVYAQRTLGAAKTGAYYASAPFIGAGVSLLLFQETPPELFWAALAVMAAGAWLARDA